MSEGLDIHKSAQNDALNKIAALVGAQLEGFTRRHEQQQQLPENNMRNYAASIPFPKPINVKDGDVVENFKFFQLQWNNYLVASGANANTEEIKKSTLLSAIGDDCLKMYTSFVLTEADQATEKSLLNAIGRNLTPVVNKRYERAIFNLATQKPKETVHIYLNRLKKLIKNCQYGELEEDLLLDKLISSIKDLSLREQLWMDKDITLEHALQKCKDKELAQKQLEALKPVDTKSPNIVQQTTEPGKQIQQQRQPQKKNKQPKNVANQQQKNVTIIQNIQGPSAPASVTPQLPKMPFKRCFNCGNHKKGLEHEANPSECPANGLTCKTCGFQNHLTTMCRKKLPNVPQPSN